MAQAQREFRTVAAKSVALRLRKNWLPPEELKLSEWAERNVVLGEEHKARPGNYRNWPYMREILDVIGDTAHPKVTVMKSARLGYTKGLVIAMGGIAATDPCQIMLLMPTDEDAAEIGVDEVEPLFETTPALKGLIRRSHSGGNNIRNKQILGGGSIKIRSARAPRKLRRLDVKVLLIDEADAIEITKEGDAIAIAEKRTLAKLNPKIVKGSTPTEEGISVVERDFNAGDGRIFEVPCPRTECGEYSEIKWEAIEYTMDETGHNVADAKWRCPSCHNLIEERYKPQMIERGVWRKLRPEIKGHASFRINCLSSLLPQATWLKVSQMWIEHDRGGPSMRQVFVNTILGRPWRVTIHRVDATTLMQRVEPWGGVAINDRHRRERLLPEDVICLTVGCDVQDDRIEAVEIGWSIHGTPFILAHTVFEGNTLDDDVWKKLDVWHRDRSWKHPNGWRLAIDGMAVDSGGREGRTQRIYDWCGDRTGRAIFAIKGDDGPSRKAWVKAKKVKGGARLVIVGTDQLKTAVIDGLGRVPVDGDGVIDTSATRFSDSLTDTFFEQLTNETRRLRYKDNRPIIKFEVKKQGLAVEALDCCVYGYAVRHSMTVKMIDLHARWIRRKTDDGSSEIKKAKRKSVADIAKEMNG